MSTILQHPKSVVLAAMVAFLVLGTWFSLASQTYNAPDERMHHAYVVAVASGRLPILTAEKIDQEAYHPPLYYFLLSPVERIVRHLPERWAVLALRWETLLLASLVIPLTWWLGKTLFPDHKLVSIVAPWLVALHPQFLYMSGVINNDALATLFATLGYCCIARLVLPTPTQRSILVTALVVTAMFLTKASIWPIAAIVFFTALFSLRRRHIPLALAMCVPLVAAAAWWFHRNVVLYGDLTSLRLQKELWYASAHRDFLTLHGIKSWFQTVYESSWARFGYFTIALGRWWYRLSYLFGAFAVIGGAGFLSRTWRTLSTRQRRVLIIFGVVAVVHVASMFLYSTIFYQAQGRFLLPLISLGALLAALAVQSIPSRFRAVAVTILVVFLAAMDAQSILTILRHQ